MDDRDLVKEEWAKAVRLAQARADAFRVMLAALQGLREACRFATFDNGVEHNGMREADYWASEALDAADAAIAAVEAAGIKS